MSDLLRSPPKSAFFRFLHKTEEWVGIVCLILLAVIPLSDFLSRQIFRVQINGALSYTLHLMLYITFFGGMLAAREGQHLATAFVTLAGVKLKRIINSVTAFFSVTFTTAFAWGSGSLLLNGFAPDANVGGIPIAIFACIMPFGLIVVAIRFATRAPISGRSKVLAMVGVLAGSYLALQPLANTWSALFGAPDWYDAVINLWLTTLSPLVWPGILLLIALAVGGMPLFLVLGGIAWLLFLPTGGSIETLANEGFTLLTDPSIPAIPLFTLVGFVMAEGKSADRFIQMFKAWFGWLPGGLIFVAVVVSAFFTTFTGASGVTILALGLLLFQILTKSGYSPAFAMGLLTASGSIGILFPPSLPMILYGSQARLSVIDMFLAGFVPGIMMVLAMTALGVFSAFKTKVERVPFHLNVALISLKDAFFDLMLPLLIIGVYFTGWMSLTETAAMAVVYVLVFQVLLLRDLRGADLHRAIIKALVIMGGILMILAMARGLSYFIIDTQMPQMLATWVKQSISSPFLFLLLLNVVLLIVGSIMEIYASILVVVPLLLPLGVVYGIDPIHLGIIFLVNMEIGFLLPPVGLNLYLASFVFKKPLGEMTRDILPFLAIQLVILLLVTYIPWFSTWLPSVVKFVP